MLAESITDSNVSRPEILVIDLDGITQSPPILDAVLVEVAVCDGDTTEADGAATLVEVPGV